ncbi:MAG: hypothetical protein CL920_10010 [Deltaproteobacteria bacterium]|nr:hypothetical protein [Deltaproteobacteria bacterium]
MRRAYFYVDIISANSVYRPFVVEHTMTKYQEFFTNAFWLRSDTSKLRQRSDDDNPYLLRCIRVILGFHKNISFARELSPGTKREHMRTSTNSVSSWVF